MLVFIHATVALMMLTDITGYFIDAKPIPFWLWGIVIGVLAGLTRNEKP